MSQTRLMEVRVADPNDLPLVARLLFDFNTEYGEPTPEPAVLAARLAALTDADILLADDVGLALMRYRQSLWSEGLECYLAELYVVPSHRGRGIGRVLLAASIERAVARGATYMDLGTSEDDVAARHLYEAFGCRRTEGDGGPLMFVYEKELG